MNRPSSRKRARRRKKKEASYRREKTTVGDAWERATVGWGADRKVIFWSCVCFVAGVGSIIGQSLKGPDYLSYYAFVFAVTWLAASVTRWTIGDEWWVSVGGLLVFETIGGVRILYGLSQGMQKFGFLILMMVIGGVIFFLRAKHFKNEGGSRSGFRRVESYDSVSGGGCGGGSGGGGGGCGGCGGE